MKLAQPAKAETIASTPVEKDKIDSNILSQLLRADLLTLSSVLSKPIRMQREFLRWHAGVVRGRTGGRERGPYRAGTKRHKSWPN